MSDLRPLAQPLDPAFFEQFRQSPGGDFYRWPLPTFELIGARFRHGRHQAGLSQRAVARRADISQSVVSRFERGLVSHTSALRIVKLAIALGPGFPFGHCPHDHTCAWPYDPTHAFDPTWPYQPPLDESPENANP